MCGGAFSPSLRGSRPRMEWVSSAAAVIEVGRVVPVDVILGDEMPSDVLAQFEGDRDASGRPDVLEVDRCPLAMVDPKSPAFGEGWLGAVSDVARGIAGDFPASWLPSDPTPALTDGVLVLRAASDAASRKRADEKGTW